MLKVLLSMAMARKVWGLSRTRDRKGKVVRRLLKPYVMCIHTDAGAGRENMWILIAEKWARKPRVYVGYAPTIRSGRTGLLVYEDNDSRRKRSKRGGVAQERALPASGDEGWVYSEELGDWFRVRKLTARECLRLMDVRESDIDKMMSLDAKGKRCVSDAQLYKCAGNSICVQPMMLTLENIFFGDGEEEQRTLFD